MEGRKKGGEILQELWTTQLLNECRRHPSVGFGTQNRHPAGHCPPIDGAVLPTGPVRLLTFKLGPELPFKTRRQPTNAKLSHSDHAQNQPPNSLYHNH